MDSGRLPAPPGLAPPGLSQMPQLPPVGLSGPPMPPISQSPIPPVNSKPVPVENVTVKGLLAEPAEPSAPSAGPVPVSNEIVKGREPAMPAEPSAPSAGPTKVESDHVPEAFKQAMATFDVPSYKKALLAVLNLIEAVDFLSTAFYCFAVFRRFSYFSFDWAVCLWFGAMLTLFSTTIFTLVYHIPGQWSQWGGIVAVVCLVCASLGILVYLIVVWLGNQSAVTLPELPTVDSDIRQGTFGVILILVIVIHFSTLMLLVTFLKKKEAVRKWKAHPENEEAKEELEYATTRMQAAAMEVPVLGSMVMWNLSPQDLGRVEKYRYWYKIGLRFVEDIPSFALSFCDLWIFGGNFVAIASLGASFVLMMVWVLSYVLDFAKEITKPLDTE